MKTLKNPPIVEALIQINYELGRAVLETDLNASVAVFGGFKSEQINQIEVLPSTAPQVSLFGYKLSNSANGEFIQITKEFFAYSGTSKYARWEDFSKSGLGRISSFLNKTQPTNINRIALRYINRIEIGDNLTQLSKYLKLYPSAGDIVSKRYESSVMQFSLSFSEDDVKANVIIRLDKTTDEKFVVFLDIDTFTMGKFKATQADISIEMERLRKIKNQIFKDCLTEELLESFNK